MMRVVTVNIQGMVFPVAQDGGETYWPIRVISEVVGIGWGAQYAKIQPPRYNPKNIDFLVPGKKSPEAHVCLSRHEFEFWLKTLNVRKVSSEARQRLTIMRQHLFGGGSSALAAGDGCVQSAVVMDRVIGRKIRSLPYAQRAAAREMIERNFMEENGCSVRDVDGGDLVKAISSMVTIISHVDKKLDITSQPVSERVDALIDKMISEAGGRYSHVDDAMVGALLCAIELEHARTA